MFDRVTSLFIEKAYAYSVKEITPNDPQGPNPNGIASGNLDTGIQNVGGNIASILALVAGGVAVIFLIYYGILYITSQGNPERTKMARAGIINAIVGIVIIVAAYAIIRFAQSIGNTVNGVVPGGY
jgi:hypothetical protein